MVGKEKEPVRKGRSGGLKIDDKTETVKPRSTSRGRDKSPKVKAVASDKVRPKSRKADINPVKPAKPDVKKTPKTPRKVPASPGRKKAEEPTNRILRPRSPARKTPIKKIITEEKRTQVINISDTDSETDTTASSSLRTRSKRTLSKEPSLELPTIRARVRHDNADIFKPLPNSVYEPISRPKVTEFSDEDVDTMPEQPPAKTYTSKARFAGFATVVATFTYCLIELALTYLVPLLCNEQQCRFRYPNLKDLDYIVASFDPAIFFSFTAFFLFNGILSIIPIGGRKYSSLATRDANFDYILNGLFAAGIHVAVLVALEVYHIPATTHIISNYFSLMTSAVVLAFIIGFILLVKSFYTRRDKLVDENQSILSSFILGAELNPRFGPMDMKFVLIRMYHIGAVLLVLSHLYQSMEMITTPPPLGDELASTWFAVIQSIRIRPTLFVLSTLLSIYFIDQLVFESGGMSTMEFKSVSFGFLKANEYMAGMFVYNAVAKYVYDYNIELASWELGLCSLIFVLGYLLYRGANSQKHAFRENPYSLLVAKFESIPTTTGKKILCSGYWGYIRHPNYLGDLLLNAALVRFVWPTPILLLFVFVTCHLILRAYVDNKRCSQRYGVAWNRYRQRVPYILIPKVF